MVPETTPDGKISLKTALIREAHEPPLLAHPGQNKTIELVKREYWWNGGYNKTRHDKTLGLLHPLPVPNHV